MFATTVAISTSVVTKDAFSQDINPAENCFIANTPPTPPRDTQSYIQSVHNFIHALPNDQALTNIATSVGLGPINSISDLWGLISNPNAPELTAENNNQFNNVILALLNTSGFDQDHQTVIDLCMISIK